MCAEKDMNIEISDLSFISSPKNYAVQGTNEKNSDKMYCLWSKYEIVKKKYVLHFFQFLKMNLFNATAAAMMELADSASIDNVNVAEAAAIMVSPAPPAGFHDLFTGNISKRELLENGVMAFLDDWRYQVSNYLEL